MNLYLNSNDNKCYISIKYDGDEKLKIKNPKNLYVKSDGEIMIKKYEDEYIISQSDNPYEVFYEKDDISFELYSILNIDGDQVDISNYISIESNEDLNDCNIIYKKYNDYNQLGTFDLNKGIKIIELQNLKTTNLKTISLTSKGSILEVSGLISISLKNDIKLKEKIPTLININGLYYSHTTLDYSVLNLILNVNVQEFIDLKIEKENINKDYNKNIIKLSITSDEEKELIFEREIRSDKIKITKSSKYELKDNSLIWKNDIKEGNNEFIFEYYTLV